MLIRPADCADNDALLDLARAISLPGLASFGADRAPDFFALDRLLGEPFATLAEEDGRAVAFVDACLGETRVGERRARSAYLSLAGVDPAHAGRGSVLSVVRNVESRLRAADCELALGLINGHNARARSFIELWPHGCVSGEPIALTVLLAGRRANAPCGVSIRAATGDDESRIAALVEAHRAPYDVAPIVKWPLGVCAQGLRWSDFRIAEDRAGRLLACLALWDQYAWRRTTVRSYGIWMNVARLLFDGLARTRGRLPLPRRGEAFRFAHVAFAAMRPGAETVFATLLSACMREIGSRGWHFLALGCPVHDPLRAALAGSIRVSMVAVPFLAPAATLARELHDRARPRTWLEYALV